MQKPKINLGFILGYTVGTIKNIPSYLYWGVVWLLIPRRRRQGRKFGEKVFRLQQDIDSQREDRN